MNISTRDSIDGLVCKTYGDPMPIRLPPYMFETSLVTSEDEVFLLTDEVPEDTPLVVNCPEDPMSSGEDLISRLRGLIRRV